MVSDCLIIMVSKEMGKGLDEDNGASDEEPSDDYGCKDFEHFGLLRGREGLRPRAGKRPR
jgi:hypothetical protein